MHAAPLRLVSGWRATKLAPELHRDRLASAVLAGPSETAQAVYLGLLGLGGTGWTRWDAGPLTTDQKVGGSSPSKRAEHLCMPEAAPGPGGRLRRFRPETELHTRATEVGHDSPHGFSQQRQDPLRLLVRGCVGRRASAAVHPSTPGDVPHSDR